MSREHAWLVLSSNFTDATAETAMEVVTNLSVEFKADIQAQCGVMEFI